MRWDSTWWLHGFYPLSYLKIAATFPRQEAGSEVTRLDKENIVVIDNEPGIKGPRGFNCGVGTVLGRLAGVGERALLMDKWVCPGEQR